MAEYSSEILAAAIRTLERNGWSYTEGAAEWRPPLGPTPEWIQRDGAVRRALMMLEAKNYWRDRALRAEAMIETYNARDDRDFEHG